MRHTVTWCMHAGECPRVLYTFPDMVSMTPCICRLVSSVYILCNQFPARPGREKVCVCGVYGCSFFQYVVCVHPQHTSCLGVRVDKPTQ